MNKNEYKCSACSGIFEKGWSDEEAKEEANDVFGKPVDIWEDEAMLVCDDCYNQMMNSEKSEKAIAYAKTKI